MGGEEEHGSGKSGVKLSQVAAAALAAVTAAVLGSTLGVAGTVFGAGIASVVTTVGSELYLRSLHRTKEAAKRTKEAAKAKVDPKVKPTKLVAPAASTAKNAAVRQAPGQHMAGYRGSQDAAQRTRTFQPVGSQGQRISGNVQPPTQQRAHQQQTTQRLPVAGNGGSDSGERTVLIPKLGEHQAASGDRWLDSTPHGNEAALSRGPWWNQRRWWLIIGTSVAGFVLCMLAVSGFEAITGKPISGGNGSTIGNMVRGGSSQGDNVDSGNEPKGDSNTPQSTAPTAPSSRTDKEGGAPASKPKESTSAAKPAPSSQESKPGRSSQQNEPKPGPGSGNDDSAGQGDTGGGSAGDTGGGDQRNGSSDG